MGGREQRWRVRMRDRAGGRREGGRLPFRFHNSLRELIRISRLVSAAKGRFVMRSGADQKSSPPLPGLYLPV